MARARADALHAFGARLRVGADVHRRDRAGCAKLSLVVVGAQAQKRMVERLGRYELLAPLAQGGTAEGFLARVSGGGGFEKVGVVKRLLDHLVEDREFVGMFLDQARLGAGLAP